MKIIFIKMQKNRLKSVPGISWETTKMVKFWLIGTEGVRSTYNSAGNMVVSIIANGVSLERQCVSWLILESVIRYPAAAWFAIYR